MVERSVVKHIRCKVIDMWIENANSVKQQLN